MGPRRGRHEGLRRDAAGRRPAAPARGPGARAGPIVLCFTADEEAGGHRGAEVLVNDHRRGVRGRHRGGRRGRRLQHHRARPPDLPHRGRREGHGLDEADRPRHRRPRLDDQPRQRRQPGSPRRWPGSGAYEWPIRLTPTMEVLLGTVGELAGTEVTPENAAGPGRGVRRRGPDARRGDQQHRQPDDALGRLQGQRRPDRGHRPRRRPVPARLRGRVLRHPGGAARRRDRRRATSATSSPGRRRTTARWSTRCTAACWPRTRTRSWRRT